MGEVGRGPSVAETESEAGGVHEPRHCEPSSSDEGEAIQGAFMAYSPWIAPILFLWAYAPRNDTFFFLRHPEPLKGAKDLGRQRLPGRPDTPSRDPSVALGDASRRRKSRGLPQDDEPRGRGPHRPITRVPCQTSNEDLGVTAGRIILRTAAWGQGGATQPQPSDVAQTQKRTGLLRKRRTVRHQSRLKCPQFPSQHSATHEQKKTVSLPLLG
jgi:hypothetical protein